jgi:hypothetical protein
MRRNQMSAHVPKRLAVPHAVGNGATRFRNFFAAIAPLCLAAGLTAAAKDYFYTFDPPNGNPALQGLVLWGLNSTNCWHTNNGASGGISDGFLEITPPINFQNVGVLFPLEHYTNTDGSVIALPLNGFLIEGDVRIGSAVGNNGRPSDGFSVSYADPTDPVIYWATKQGQFRGWAGGDSSGEALEPSTFDYSVGIGEMDPFTCDATDAENGTKTGVSVQFDAWAGNTIIDENGASTNSNDNVGWRVHYKGKLLQRVIAQPPSGSLGGNSPDGDNDLNGLAVCPASDTGFDQNSRCKDAVCADPYTLQTGPYNSIYNGSVANLCWAHFSVELSTGTPHELTVVYKGRPVIDHLILTNYVPFNGQFVLGGRTASANENCDLDNLHIVTYPALQAIFKGITSASSFVSDFTLTLASVGSAKVTAITQVTLDGTDITASTNTVKVFADPLSTATFHSPTNLAPGLHSAGITFEDTFGTVQTFSAPFKVLPWYVLPASLAVTGVDTNVANQGLRILAHQTLQKEPNRLYWADEELMGLHGTNLIDFSAVNSYDPSTGEVVWQGPVFLNHSALGRPAPADFSALGIAGIYANTNAPYDNFALACEAYLYFPTNGTYVMGINSDDGARVTVAGNSHDVLGTEVPGLSADYSRTFNPDQNLVALVVTAPGYYGFRVLYENGTADAGLAWYFKSTPATNAEILINDVLNYPDTAIAAYQLSAAAPSYVSFAEPPLDDDQVASDADFKWRLTDGAAAVDSSSVILSLNGETQAPAVSKSGGLTTISLPHTPGQLHATGTNVVDLLFTDSAVTIYDYNYSFVVNGLPSIRINVNGVSWVITYTGTLYSSPTVNGTYAPVLGASSPYTVPIGSGPSRFYRSVR